MFDDKENLNDVETSSDTISEKSLFSKIWKKVKTKTMSTQNDLEEHDISDENGNEENTVAKEETDVPKVADTFIHKYWLLWKENPEDAPPHPLHSFQLEQKEKLELPQPASKSLYSEKTLETEQQDFIFQMENIAAATVKNVELSQQLNEENKPVNSEFIIKMSHDSMFAVIFLLPPLYNGEHVTKEAIMDSLSQINIIFGVKEYKIDAIVEKKQYFKMFVIATGESPVNGTDGEIIDKFPRSHAIQIKENEDGIADFKQLNQITNINKGTIICDIVKPTEGTNGTNIKGEPVRCIPGKAATVPRGLNTVLSADGFSLVSDIEGHVTFADGRFKVEKILTVKGDVDISIGNLNFVGDILVFGDVRSNFEIKAAGNVIIRGMVEGATIIAQGDITVEKGMNGNNKGVLDSKGNINCKYLENCTVHAVGCIYAESIIGSNIFCDDKVVILANKGVIIGSNLTVFKSIEAKVIGSKANRNISIVMGSTPNMLKEKEQQVTLLKSIQSELLELTKNISFLEGKNTSITTQQQALLNSSKLKKTLLQIKEKQAVTQLEKINHDLFDVSECRIVCSSLFPPAKITIGNAFKLIQNNENKVRLFYSNGEVTIGMG